MKKVHVVHAIDTEGPLYESLRANFERIFQEFGISVEANYENLYKLRNKKINLNGKEDIVARTLSADRTTYLETWDQIDQMLDVVTSDKFRKKLTDCDGNGWVYNWMCMDHVGIEGINPRRRDMGFHNIFDHYRDYLDKHNNHKDLIQWHYHSLSITNDAHRCGSTYLNSNHVHSILTRRVIDRSWFPSVFRAGHNTERPDSNLFLEQWIPFDYSNTSAPKMIDHEEISSARYGDWRFAPTEWRPYHPNHDNYQKKGSCRRFITRCLPVNDRGYSIKYQDVVQAFDEADKYNGSILSVTNHDFRNLKPDVEKIMKFIERASFDFPEVDFKFSDAVSAMREVCAPNKVTKIGINVKLIKYTNHSRLDVFAENNIFGPQPYLAIKTKGGHYYWQNFDFEQENHWSYSFDNNNLMIDEVAQIGVAANSTCGLTEVVNIIPATSKTTHTILNK
jgi:hypothetical protein